MFWLVFCRKPAILVIAAVALLIGTTAAIKVPTDTQSSDSSTSQQSSKASSSSAGVANTGGNSTVVSAVGRGLSRKLTVSGSTQWTDTGIDVQAGDRIVLSASGTLSFTGYECDPDGRPRSWKDLLHGMPVNSAGSGALVGRIGGANFAEPFLVGKQRDIAVQSSGRLFLGINEPANETGEGEYEVTLQLQPAKATRSANLKSTSPTVTLSNDLLKGIPRRVVDSQQNEGDLVNFLVVGNEEKLKSAFSSAGWVVVDRTKNQAVLNAALLTLQKKTYLEMPMSELYLFGRPQDFGYAHAEPIKVVASRNHLRIWRAPTDFGGKPLWVGAATHDIGFERDQRNGGVTHKIDQNVDDEREFVGSTLMATGMVAQKSYLTPADSIREAHTATGGSFHSDGRVMVLVLR